jgi:FtsH-binding integral membrane protein
MRMVQQRRNTVRTRAINIFIGLAVVYAVLAIVANVVFSGNTLVQTLLLSLDSAVLGSGIVFFLTKVYGLEQAHDQLPSSIEIFIALAVVFVVLVLLALLLFAANPFFYTLLLTTGTAIFAGGLTFFLVKLA